MATSSHLHRYIYFYQSEKALAFAATTSGAALVIDRATAKLGLQGTLHTDIDANVTVLNTSTFSPPETVYGILGTIRLRLGLNLLLKVLLTEDTYVILITGRESVGHLTSHEIWRLTKFEIVPLRLQKGHAIKVVPARSIANFRTRTKQAS
jgi:hypothetical protein